MHGWMEIRDVNAIDASSATAPTAFIDFASYPLGPLAPPTFAQLTLAAAGELDSDPLVDEARQVKRALLPPRHDGWRWLAN